MLLLELRQLLLSDIYNTKIFIFTRLLLSLPTFAFAVIHKVVKRKLGTWRNCTRDRFLQAIKVLNAGFELVFIALCLRKEETNTWQFWHKKDNFRLRIKNNYSYEEEKKKGIRSARFMVQNAMCSCRACCKLKKTKGPTLTNQQHKAQGEGSRKYLSWSTHRTIGPRNELKRDMVIGQNHPEPVHSPTQELVTQTYLHIAVCTQMKSSYSSM